MFLFFYGMFIGFSSALVLYVMLLGMGVNLPTPKVEETKEKKDRERRRRAEGWGLLSHHRRNHRTYHEHY